jgi:hypothetical protein
MQAAVLRTRYEWSIVSGTLEGHIQAATSGTRELLELGGRLIIYTIWVDQFQAEPRWARFWSKTAKDETGERTICALRAGGAALLAGCISVAIRIALDIRGQDLNALKSFIKDEQVAAKENFLSKAYGFLLSADPEQAIIDFLDFAEEIQGAVK